MAEAKPVYELETQTRKLAIAAFTSAHVSAPDIGFAPDRAWIEGWAYAQTAAPAPAAVAVHAMQWRAIKDGMPEWTDDNSIRVIAITAEDDFSGAQVHDVAAADFHIRDPEGPTDPDSVGTEVTRACTRWAYRDGIWPRAALAATPAAQAQPVASRYRWSKFHEWQVGLAELLTNETFIKAQQEGKFEMRPLYDVPQAQPLEAAAEHQALRDVYEQARGVLRHDGVDQQRALKYRDGLIEAIEAVKAIDGGNWEAEAPMSDDDAAELILETMAVHCDKDAWHQAIEVHKVLLSRYVESAPQAQDVQDAGLLDWLSKQYIGPDFRWGEPATEVVVIEMPKGCSYCGDFKADMRAAIAASAAKGGAQ